MSGSRVGEQYDGETRNMSIGPKESVRWPGKLEDKSQETVM